jgi:ribosomal protein S18 acetylase RimI-like enzyme
MNAPLFRFAAPADAGQVAALIERAYRGPETAGRWDSESHLLTGPRTSVEEIRSLIARNDSRFLLAVEDDVIVGCALIQQTAVASEAYFVRFATPGLLASSAGPIASSSQAGCYFGMFATDPNIRSAGLGKLVLAEAEARARKLFGAVAMVMTVISVRSGLIAWYQRRGYRLTGERVPFPFTATSGETTRDFDLIELRKDFS